MKESVGVFSFGYWGWGSRVPEMHRRALQVNREARGRGIKWVDLRIRRNVRAKGFNGKAPEQLLGKAYSWIPALGNVRVLLRRSGIEIHDFDRGLALFVAEIEMAQRERTDLVVFCACKLPGECHRTTVIRRLRRKIPPGVQLLGELVLDPTAGGRALSARPSR